MRRGFLRNGFFAVLSIMLSGCDWVVLHPSGDVAAQERDLLITSTWLMLLIIVPVMVTTILFAWRYRESNQSADYRPDWAHSTQLELLIWSAPLLIVTALGALTWLGTHILDPYRPLDRISESKGLQPGVVPLTVEVVALDWKWLFIYPEYHIASVNELAAPVDRPIEFRISSTTVMNAFYVPALAGMVYAMPGMETPMHAVINQTGDFEGFSANYSGLGFSGMRFRFHALSPDDFDRWLQRVKDSERVLDRASYAEVERPSFNVPVSYYGGVASDLYHAILNMCVNPGKMCADEMRHVDRNGGLGLAGVDLITPLSHDRALFAGSTPAARYLQALCGISPETASQAGPRRAPAALEPGRPAL